MKAKPRKHQMEVRVILDKAYKKCGEMSAAQSMLHDNTQKFVANLSLIKF